MIYHPRYLAEALGMGWVCCPRCRYLYQGYCHHRCCFHLGEVAAVVAVEAVAEALAAAAAAVQVEGWELAEGLDSE